MFNTLHKYVKLTGLIIRHGRFRHSGENFNALREEALKELQEFIPDQPSRAITQRGGTTSSPDVSPIYQNFKAQSAFIKNSLKIRGGHLTFKNLSYIRIPKSASTSMCQELLEKKYPTLTQKKISGKEINFLTDVNLEVKATGSSIFFTIVRNPFSRLVSVYRDFFENKDHYIYRDYLFGILPQQLTFSEFINRISSIPDRLKDQHIRPQHSFLEYYRRKKLEIKIFKLEESEKLNQFLNQQGMKFPHVNKSDVHYDYRSYYDAVLLQKVHELYQIDVEKFGYQEEYNLLTKSLKASKPSP